MPIILEVNDYDSENDLSSTEDDNTNLPNIESKVKKKNKKNNKIKAKKKKSILKESKIVKDTAKKKIKVMEKKILKTNYNYTNIKKTNEQIKQETSKEIREFFTDEELADQLEELRKLEKKQIQMWKNSANTQVAVPKIKERAKTISGIMPLMISNSSMIHSIQKKQNNSRTQKLNSNSIVNTNIPVLNRSKMINRGYSNIGKMW